MADIGLVVASAVGAFAGGGLGAGASFAVARSRQREARREEWFRRFQHVSALVLGATDRERDAGLALLRVLVRDPATGPAEEDMGETLLAEVLGTGKFGAALAQYSVSEDDLLAPAEESVPWHPTLVSEEDAVDGDAEHGADAGD